MTIDLATAPASPSVLVAGGMLSVWLGGRVILAEAADYGGCARAGRWLASNGWRAWDALGKESAASAGIPDFQERIRTAWRSSIGELAPVG